MLFFVKYSTKTLNSVLEEYCGISLQKYYDKRSEIIDDMVKKCNSPHYAIISKQKYSNMTVNSLKNIWINRIKHLWYT